MRAVAVVQINSRSEIILNLSDDIPMMSGDDGALEQVFINVLNNAIESMPEGGSVVVGMNYNSTTKEIETTIKDFGNGIDDATRNKIYLCRFSRQKNRVWDSAYPFAKKLLPLITEELSLLPISRKAQ